MLHKVNGRNYYFDHITKLNRVSRSKWIAERYGVEFVIEGGRHCGGSRNEWMLDCPEHFKGTIFCTSIVDALMLIDRM